MQNRSSSNSRVKVIPAILAQADITVIRHSWDLLSDQSFSHIKKGASKHTPSPPILTFTSSCQELTLLQKGKSHHIWQDLNICISNNVKPQYHETKSFALLSSTACTRGWKSIECNLFNLGNSWSVGSDNLIYWHKPNLAEPSVNSVIIIMHASTTYNQHRLRSWYILKLAITQNALAITQNTLKIPSNNRNYPEHLLNHPKHKQMPRIP